MNKILLLFLVVSVTSSFQKKEVQWVALGDSITYLNEHLDETGNRITKGYMTRVIDQLPHIKYTNQGHNGWTAGNIADGIEKLGLEKADVYSIFLGTNDWWQGRPIGTIDDYKNDRGNKTFFGSFRIIINKLRQLNSQADILLITPMQRVDFVYIADSKNNAYGSYKEKNGQTLAQFAKAIIAIGAFERCKVIDLYNNSGITLKNLVKFKRVKDPKSGQYKNYPYPQFIDIPFNPETDEYPYPPAAVGMTFDGLHPSDKGYAVIAAMLVKWMKRY